MTDATFSPAASGGPSSSRAGFFSEEALARVKRRHRADRRFRLAGLSAVLLASFFVVMLLGDIVSKGLPAFFEHRVMLEIELDAARLDPQGKREPAALREADYQRLLADAFRSRFPHVTDRRERRKLEGVISAGAGDDLRALVLRDPARLGEKIRFPVLLSDDADLYLKGLGTPITRRAGSGGLEIAVNGNRAEITGAPEAFAAVLGAIKTHLGRQLALVEAELARLPAARAGADNAALEARRTELSGRVAELRRRINDGAAAETIDFSTMPSQLVAAGGGMIRLEEVGPGKATGTVLLPLAAGAVPAGQWQALTYEIPEGNRRLSDVETAWLESLRQAGLVERGFAWRFFTSGDSREPELAGIRGALIGSALTLLVTLAVCLPLGVGAAVYLEEFAPKNRFTDILEVNINNLAAVPSIVFGLLGLAMFLNFFGLPRSAPVVGGLVLALLVLPTIIIASRAALKAVPPSIKEAALGVGASHQQAIFHHVLPLAMPGIMTGTIIGMAHALGETAPLLMIGMVAFIVDIPTAISDPATVLPVQIYLWSDLPEVAFQAKTAAAIMVLLAFLFVMNGAAILLRRRFERRW